MRCLDKPAPIAVLGRAGAGLPRLVQRDPAGSVASFGSDISSRLPYRMQAMAAAYIRISNDWGTRLRRFREQLGLSQEQLCAAMRTAYQARDAGQDALLKGLHIDSPAPIASYELSRFEKGIRIPVHRETHLLLVWALRSLDPRMSATGAAACDDGVNAWLELARQGWLTDRERILLRATLPLASTLGGADTHAVAD